MFKGGSAKEMIHESAEKNTKNPSEYLITLGRKELEKEFQILNKGVTNNEDLEKHLRNIEMISREMAIYQEFGKKAEIEMLQNASKDELNENNKENTFRSFTIKQFLDSKFDSLKSKFAQKIKPIKYAALALMFSLQPMVSQSQNKAEVKGLDKNKLEDTRTSNINKTTEDPNKTYNLGANFRFTTENENGEKESNILGGIIAPIALELDVNKKVDGNIEANIPLTYARDFKNTDLTNKEDSLKMAKYFEDQIREVVANTLIRIGETKGVYNANHEKGDNLLKEAFSKLKITSINITGYASPEASAAKSVIPGNKEEENAKLAEKRAQIVQGVVEKILNENKVDSSVLDSINFEEVQFSDGEWSRLIGLAEVLGIKGSAPEDQILELVSRYNNGEYNENASVKKVMDEVIGSKRGATIEIGYETNKKTQIVVPIPLLLLLLLSKRIRRGINPLNWKRDRSNSEEEIKKEGGVVIETNLKTPREIFSEKDIDKENVSKGEFNYYKLYETADKEINYQDKYLIRKYFLEGELSIYIDDEVSLKHGLDYRNLINYISSVRDRYNTEEELKVEIARSLLEMWEQYDRSVRKEAGVEINKETTLDYRHDEKKILWAKIAAPEILRLAHNYNNPEDLLVEIQKIIQEFEEKVKSEREKNTNIIGIKPIGEKANGLNKGINTEESTSISFNEGVRIEEKKGINEMSQEEYDGMYDDIKMINRKIKDSEGIVTLEESDFKSAYGKKRYNEIKHIKGGKDITFNKEELQTIGDELESFLSKAKIVIKEKEEEKKMIQLEKDNLRADLEMLNKSIQHSEGIVNLEESSFKSEYGKKRYLELKQMKGGKGFSFNKEELENIALELENALVGPRKIETIKLKNKSEENTQKFDTTKVSIGKKEEEIKKTKNEIISTYENTSNEQQKVHKEIISRDSIERVIAKKIGNKAEIEKLELNFNGEKGEIYGELDAGFIGGKIKIEGSIENNGNSIIVSKNLKIEARSYVKSRIENNLSNLVPEIMKYYEDKFKDKYKNGIKSMKIENGALSLEFKE